MCVVIAERSSTNRNNSTIVILQFYWHSFYSDRASLCLVWPDQSRIQVNRVAGHDVSREAHVIRLLVLMYR